ncbi:hypothetical protein Cgig2_033355 [Carnegiea gigantea]|uniref:Uncharacterized protein n=1 Tax=Carnegiea gigantea TaxID=171969 RepID=A0A9Q1KSL6_9CARY|nr:hypothetical protein Cgig2_033355 [Carnegiea gigantea]
MKGHPGTGKSTIAEAIATSLRCPLLDKDDIRDATLSLSSATSAALNDLSYDALWRVAATQIRLGLSVVLDSPLSRRRHLDRILTFAGNHRVLIVECRASDHAEWRRRVERRAAEQGRGHKPATWQDLERLLGRYDGCTEYDVGEVPRLVVDTTGSGGHHGVLSSVMEFIQAMPWEEQLQLGTDNTESFLEGSHQPLGKTLVAVEMHKRSAVVAVVVVGPDKGIGIWYNSCTEHPNPISFAALMMMLVAQFGERE